MFDVPKFNIMKTFYCTLFLSFCLFLNAQVGIGTSNPHDSAILELKSNDSGVLIPRMTALERNNNINIPTAGLLVYQTDGNEGFYYYDGGLSTWVALNEDNDPQNELELPQAPNAGDMAYWDGGTWEVIPATVNEGATLQMISGVPTWVGGTPPALPLPEIGDFYEGGVVFYLAPTPTDLDGDGDLDNGLVCSIKEQGKVQW